MRNDFNEAFYFYLNQSETIEVPSDSFKIFNDDTSIDIFEGSMD